jgi:hypothetical protein
MKLLAVRWLGGWVFLLTAASVGAQVWDAPVREVSRADLPDVAVASYDAYGPIIYYNPNVLAKVGPVLSAFFRAHEHAHISQKHIQREMFGANPYNRVGLRQSYEKEADCEAARVLARVSPAHVEQSAQFFETTLGPNRPDWLHPTGYERAAVIRQCGAEMSIPPIGAGVPTRTIREPCQHPAHPDGDPIQCSHPAHSSGDIYPCQHACYDYYGRLFACHAMGDVMPCNHPMHVAGDRAYCTHAAHPSGHERVVTAL